MEKEPNANHIKEKMIFSRLFPGNWINKSNRWEERARKRHPKQKTMTREEMKQWLDTQWPQAAFQEREGNKGA